jgi:16S rRNA G1207 methylase RsmC
LLLSRFPENQHAPNLQAWDAADEYLIRYLNDQQQPKTQSNIIIFNDTFGALSLTLSAHANQVFSVSDSLISHQGLLNNLAKNKLANNNITLLTSLDKLPQHVDLVLYKIPKSNALLVEQLIQIKQCSCSSTLFIAAAKAKDIHSSTLKLFEKYLGTTTTSLAVKKARLVFSNLDQQNQYQSPYPTVWPLENTPFTLTNHANVFARDKLDIGARFFMQYLPNVQPSAKVIDLGCGNGVIGLSLLAKQPQAQVTFIDESYMAVRSAQLNIKNNLPNLFSQCQFMNNDCLANIADQSADIIVCNPPFHQQQTVTDHIAWQMFNESFRVLKKGGEMRIIGNRQLGYHVKLARLFERTTLIASNKKFVVISALKA